MHYYRFQHILFLLCLVISSTNGFFSKASTLRQYQHAPVGPRTFKYFNLTYWTSFQRPQREYAPRMRKKGETVQEVDEASLGPRDKIHRIVMAIGRVLYAIKASVAIFAIQSVLKFKMERYVLGRLPPSLLIFLLEVSFNNPEVIRSIARELGERISAEICSFTGKSTYHAGDISKAIMARYTGSEDYRFGDVTRATFLRMTHQQKAEQVGGKRTLADVMRGFGGEQFDCNKEMESLLYKITGKKEYEFGDVTKALLKRMEVK